MKSYSEVFQYPSPQESKEIKDSFPPIKEIFLSSNGIEAKKEFHRQDFQDFIAQHDITNWICTINNTLGKVKFSYVLSKFYYLKGIEDDEWKVDLDSGGTKFFPHFEDDGDRYLQFLFNYSVENFYFRYVTSLDRLAQLLNIYYNLGFNEKQVAFNDKLSKRLKDIDSILSEAVDKFISKSKTTYESRNVLTHRFPFNEIDLRSQKHLDEHGREVTTLGSAKYTNSKEMIRDIENSVELLSKILRAVELALTTKNS